MNRSIGLFACAWAVAVAAVACSSNNSPAADDGGTCAYVDAGASADDGSSSNTCPATACPTGTVCVFEVGGLASGGGSSCVPIPPACHGTPSCACMAGCVCTNSAGGRPESCSEQSGSIACDNGIR